MQLDIRTKIFGFFAGLIVLVLVLVLANFYAFQQAAFVVMNQHHTLHHGYEVIAVASEYLVSMQDVERGAQQYLLTSDTNFLEIYEKGLDDTKHYFERLRQMTTGNTLQQTRLDHIDELMASRLAEMKSVLLMAQTNRQTEALAAIKQSPNSGILKEIHAEIDLIIAEENRLVQLRKSSVKEKEQFLFGLFTSEAIILLLLAFYLVYKAQRAFVRPLKALSQYAELIGEGKTVGKLRLEGNDEIAKLAAAFNKMSHDIQERNQDVETRGVYEHALSEILAACNEPSKLDRTLNRVLQVHAENHPSPLGAIFLADNKKDGLHLVASYGLSCEFEDKDRACTGLLAQVYQDAKRHILTTDLPDGFKIDMGLGDIRPRQVVLEPIHYREKVLGVLVLAYMLEVNEQDIEYIDNMSLHLGSTIQNGLQYLQLQELTNELEKSRQKVLAERDEAVEASIRDPLTGAHNRGFLDIEIRRLLSMSKRYHESVALVMLDIDHFKNINDSYGHMVGDEVLRALAVLLMEQTRKSDIVARYGGEEFVIVLQKTTLPKAQKVAEKLRQAVEEMEVPGLEGKRITISLGVGMLPELDVINGDSESFYVQVDKAMYRAKQAGRNRVCMVESGDEPVMVAAKKPA